MNTALALLGLGLVLAGILVFFLLGPEPREASAGVPPFYREGLDRWLQVRARLWALGQRWERGLRRRLLAADLPWRPSEFVGLALLLAGLGAWGGWMIYRLPGLAVAGALAGGALPVLWLRHRQAGRQRRLEAQLADALLQIAGAMRAGGSLPAALQQAADQLPLPIGLELRRVVLEFHLGIPLAQALEHLRARVPSEDLSMAITAIQIHQQVGGNLPEFLERVAARIRERVYLRNEIRALTASQRLSAQIMAVLPLVLWLILFPLNRRYMMRFFTSGLLGYALLALILFLVLAGLLVVRRATRLEV